MENHGTTQPQNEIKNEKQAILINPTLKELTEFLSDLFPVLGSIFLIIVYLAQIWYSSTAENFYGIDKSLFYSKNLVYFVAITIGTSFLFVTQLFLYRNLDTVQKKDWQVILTRFLLSFGSMILPLYFFMMKFPNWILNLILFIMSIAISVLDIVLSDESKEKSNPIHNVIRIIIICAYFFSIFLYVKAIIKSHVEFKKDYEIAYPIDSNNTDWYYNIRNYDSQIYDIVILHNDSQVLIMKGSKKESKIGDKKEVQLTLYKGVYCFKDIDKYVYVKEHFDVVSPIESYPTVVSPSEISPSEEVQTYVSPSKLSK